MRDEHLQPVDHSSPTAARSLPGCRLRIRKLDECLAGTELDENFLPRRGRVDDEIRFAYLGRPLAAPRKDAGARKRRVKKRCVKKDQKRRS